MALNGRLLRMLDANLNRFSEGVRVIEDYARFVRDDRKNALLLKNFRHKIRAVCGGAVACGAAFRDTPGDTGKDVRSVKSEYVRAGVSDILTRNFSRAAESARVIEELLKTVSAAGAQEIEKIRYGLYALETRIVPSVLRAARIADRPLMAVVHPEKHRTRLTAFLKKIARDGVVVQFRCKNVTEKEYLAYVRSGLTVLRAAGCPLIVNDSLAVALTAGADGVHLGQDDLPPAAARKIAGELLLIGRSTHTVAEAKVAAHEYADYIGIGCVAATGTKNTPRVIGIEKAARIARTVKLPGYAIGGIDAALARGLKRAGCRRIAVSSAIENSPVPGKLVGKLLDILRK